VLPCLLRMDPQPAVEVDIDLTLLDLFRAGLSIMIYYLRFLICGFVLIFCVSVTSLIFTMSDPPPRIAETIESWTLPVVVGGIPALIVLVPLVTFIRSWRVLKAEGMDGRRHYTFSDEGIVLQSRMANANVKWEAYMKVRETRRYFLLYAAPGFANVVPKRCFNNQTGIVAFRSLTRAHAREFKLRG